MGEANRDDCSICRERSTTCKLSGAKGLDLRRTLFGLLLLVTSITFAMGDNTRLHTKLGTVLGHTSNRRNAVGDLGTSRREINALDKISQMLDNIDAIHPNGAATQATEQPKQRGKRETGSENGDTSRRNDSDADGSRLIHSESQQTEATDLEDFKQRISLATSFEEIQAIFQSRFSNQSQSTQTSINDLERQLSQCRRSKSSVGVTSSSAGRSNGKTNTKVTKRKLLKAIQANTTLNRTLATIVSKFGLKDREEFEFYGPKVTNGSASTPQVGLTTEQVENITLKAQNYTRWVTRIFNKGLCRPVEMILNLEREGKMDSTSRAAKALVRVKKCHLLYASPINQENVTCVAVKENARLIPIEYGDVVKTYIVSDHLQCKATSNRSTDVRKVENATSDNTKKGKSGMKQKRLCPWPFQKFMIKNVTRCSCNKTKNGSPGYLDFLTCRNVQKGIWKLETKQAKCVKKELCRKPVCDRNLKFNVEKGRCPKRKPAAKPRRHSRRKPNT